MQAMSAEGPPVESIGNQPNAPQKCFLISPIGDSGTDERRDADQVLRHLVRGALEPYGFLVLRGDQDTNPGLITPRILTSIAEADLIVADLSRLNPNVFYELAVAHALQKPIVHLQTEGESLPFDIQNLRRIPRASSYIAKVSPAYPVPTVDRDAQLDLIQPWLRANGILSRGRMRTWMYEIGNMDHAVRMGFELAEYLVLGIPEKLYRHGKPGSPRRGSTTAEAVS
jgi:hypothetical protein